jgi:hypothetical protein
MYELLASGGTYMIRRTYQVEPRKETYAGPWAHCEAERMWKLILTGEVSLWSGGLRRSARNHPVDLCRSNPHLRYGLPLT